MLEEQAVVAHAQANQHIQFRSCRRQQHGLSDRIAECLELTRPDLLFIGQANLLLREGSNLAYYRGYLEVIRSENILC
jgi:hypothetical protein